MSVSLGLLLASPIVHSAEVDQISQDGTAYLLFSVPNKIERFDLINGAELEPISLSQEPTAIAVRDGVAYVGFQRELRSINLDTLESQFIRNFPDRINDIEIIGDAIYVFTPTGYDGTTTILSLADNSLLGEFEQFDSGRYFTAGSDAYYFRDTGVSPSDIHKQAVNVDGSLSESELESPYHGDYPGASHVWVSPDDSRVFDDSGTVYFTEALTFAGSLGGRFSAMTFVDGNPVVARGNSLYLFTSHLLEAGSQETAIEPGYLASHGNNIYAFSLDNSGYTVEHIDVSGFELPTPGTPLDGNTTNYSIDKIQTDGSDIAYVLDSSLLSIFRWSAVEETHLQTWPLINPPTWMSYVESHQRLYLGYSSGKISYFDTSEANAVETHFTTLPGRVLGLASAGEYLFAADPSGAWGSFYTFAQDGTLLSSDEWKNAASAEYIWSSSTNRIYHYRDNTSPNDLEWTHIDPETGLLGDEGDSIYHGDTLSTRYPIRINATGDVLLNGAGQFISASDVKVVNSLSNNISDAAWVGSQLITVNAQTQTLQVWSENYELLSDTYLANVAIQSISEVAGKLLIVGFSDGEPEYRLLDLDADGDADGTKDLIDNCINIANQDQADFDNDGLGDACDLDSDDDGISNELEIASNLDPLNPDDAEGDLDSDGYSNRVEIISGSDISDPQSTPTEITSYIEDFENGWPAGFYVLSGTGVVAPGGEANSSALHIGPSSGLPSVAFSAVFSTGVLSFRTTSLAPWYNAPSVEVFIDGVSVTTTSVDSEDWSTVTITLESGEHTISFGTNTSVYGGDGYGVIIDNITFGADRDKDGINDEADNCPNHSNRWQYDEDADGQGDACDPLPYDPNPPADRDEDTIFDYADNCPDTPNSEQADIDGDGIGDACDPIDDRPLDSDQDGIEDRWDNCPVNANFSQDDFDQDNQGDACDDDIDGDGIANTIEDTYLFLSSYDPSDAFDDEDNDGASNFYEINNGFSPTEPNEYPAIDLRQYAMGPEGTYVYANNDSTGRRFWVIDQIHLPESETYLFTSGSYHHELGITDQGLEILFSGDYFTYPHNNDVLLPNSMKEGETITFNGYHGAANYQSEPSEKRISLVSKGEFIFKGASYPTVTIKIETGIAPYFNSITETYAKGLGLVITNDLVLQRILKLESDEEIVVLDAEEKIIDGEDSEPTATEDNNHNNSSGGPFDIRNMGILLLLLLEVRRRKTN